MKQTSFLLFTISILLCGAISCNDPIDKDDDIFIIDPVYSPMFQFDDYGIPYRYESPTLSADMQQSLNTEVVGYGWKWMQTFEIDTDGSVKNEPFYESFGLNPDSYYIQSDTTLTRYFHSDVTNKDVFLDWHFCLDAETGTLSDGTKLFAGDAWSCFLRIWSIFTINGRWYINCVSPLCMRYNSIGVSQIIWGVSQYARMSEEELKQMQKQYTFDYSQLN